MVGPGERYPCEPLGNGSFGRLLLFWPSIFQGGGFLLDSIIDYPQCSREDEFNWVAILGEMKEHLPIIAGRLTVFSFLIKFGKDNGANCVVDNRAKLSQQTAPFRPQLIPYCAKELDWESFGLLLSCEYITNKTFSLDMLTGLDRQMVSAFKPYGCTFEIIPVAYCLSTTGINSAVYSLTREDVQRIIGDTVVPMCPKQPLLPFFWMGKGYLTPTIELGRDYSTDHTQVYLMPALIVRFPNWWTRGRLLWIAQKKNNPIECPIACLPRDMIRIIIKIIRTEVATKTIKRKLETMESGNY